MSFHYTGRFPISQTESYMWRVMEYRTQFRRDANVADNKAATVAVDSLMNYEAVKVSLLHFSFT